MPKFVIERQYLVPMYQHIVVEAENLEEACKKGISDGFVAVEALNTKLVA